LNNQLLLINGLLVTVQMPGPTVALPFAAPTVALLAEQNGTTVVPVAPVSTHSDDTAGHCSRYYYNLAAQIVGAEQLFFAIEMVLICETARQAVFAVVALCWAMFFPLVFLAAADWNLRQGILNCSFADSQHGLHQKLFLLPVVPAIQNSFALLLLSLQPGW
jgi:hypothetical protein